MHNLKNMVARSPLDCATGPTKVTRCRVVLLPLVLLCLGACHSPGPAGAGPDVLPYVTAALETEPVGRTGDAADDPVILATSEDTVWIVGTDKQFGLLVYDLTGDELHALETGRLNNVDAVALDDGTFLLAASNRTTPAIDLYLARPDLDQIELVNRIPLDLVDPYGLCMAVIDSRATVFVGDKTGVVQRWVIDDDRAGTIQKTYNFKIGRAHV